jgi:hypothetical protein
MDASFDVLPEPTRAETTDPRIPPREQVVTRSLMERWNRECPDKVFVKFADDGEAWTYREFRQLVLQTAIGLQRLGVAQGDHVLVWLPNGREHLRVFFALNYLGAVFVPINTAYKGALLAHVIENSDARLAVVHADLAARLEGVALAALTDAVVVGERHQPAEHRPPLERIEAALVVDRSAPLVDALRGMQRAWSTAQERPVDLGPVLEAVRALREQLASAPQAAPRDALRRQLLGRADQALGGEVSAPPDGSSDQLLAALGVIEQLTVQMAQAAQRRLPADEHQAFLEELRRLVARAVTSLAG